LQYLSQEIKRSSWESNRDPPKYNYIFYHYTSLSSKDNTELLPNKVIPNQAMET